MLGQLKFPSDAGICRVLDRRGRSRPHGGAGPIAFRRDLTTSRIRSKSTTRRCRRRQDPRLQLWILVIARLFRADWLATGNQHKFVVMRELHHLARRKQWPRGLLPRHPKVTQPGTEPMPRIVLHGAHFGRRAKGVRDALGGPLVVGGEPITARASFVAERSR
jgi:hypothetical protein